MAANVFTIPAGAAFADLLVRGVLQTQDPAGDPFALADTTILVPTRRAVRTLQDSFAERLGGAALLPRIYPLGATDEEELLPDGEPDDLALPPVIDPVRRRLLLAFLVQRWDRARSGGEGSIAFAQAASLAAGLAQFLDEAETQNADLSKLESLAGSAFAEHWQQVRDFLAFVRDAWPRLAAEEGATSPATARNQALAALAQRYRDRPGSAPVIAAGTTGSIPATASLLRVIAGLDHGAVVLPGLDRDLDEESWKSLDESHAQFGLKQLLEGIGIARCDVRNWAPQDVSPGRAKLLRETLRPAPTTDAWRALATDASNQISEGLEGIALVEAAHPAEEAAAISLILRDALEKAGQTAALVTPDRNLARRVAAELGRWSIKIDDSAGRPLANTPPGAFLSLVAEAANEEFAPIPLLALLKHPFAAAGYPPAEFRRLVRILDRLVLRGPRPDPGLNGIATAIAAAPARTKDAQAAALAASLQAWWRDCAAILAPFAAAMAERALPLSEIVNRHVISAERLAATDTETGVARLWSGAAGEAAQSLISALEQSAADLPPFETNSYPPFFRTLAGERAVRPPYRTHPRLAILGPLEARLQHFDVLVLGGLNEGTWPGIPAADPWLSRPMRKMLGLEAPERRIGLAAHDFASLAASPRVFLTRSVKSEGAPTVASRWIERLKQLTKGLGLAQRIECTEPYTAYASRIDLPDTSARPEPRPAPRPALSLRPRSLSVTEIETWLRDPYAIYARHVLKLRPLDPVDAEIGPLERGSAVHLVLERFVKKFGGALPPDALDNLLAIADGVFAEFGIPRAAVALWKPRLARAADWFLGMEQARRSTIHTSYTEVWGERIFAAPAGAFVLRGRADRIDVLHNGGAAIIDYKTGQPPSNRQIEALLAPQLPLEGAILESGGFKDAGAHPALELIHVKLSGGPVPGDWKPIKGNIGELVQRAVELLSQRVADFDDETTPYPSRFAPFRSDIKGVYDHLARTGEWSASGWKEDQA